MLSFFKIVDSIRVILKSKKPFSDFLKKGSSIASTQVSFLLKNYVQDIATLIDVGANQGQFALSVAYVYPTAHIYSFEPVPETFGKLKKNTASNENISVYNYALGSSTGNIDFFVNDHSHASSALPVSEQQKSALPFTANATKVQVPIDTLTNFMSHNRLATPILLKMDVQGYEKEVLTGGASMLPLIDYVLFETSFIAMYQNEPLFDEMHTYMKELGFEIVAPLDILRSDDLQILQMDILYRRVKNSNETENFN